MKATIGFLSIRLTGYDMGRLNPDLSVKGGWLNDYIIDAYGLMIVNRGVERYEKNPSDRPVHFFSSHFMDSLIGKDETTKGFKDQFDYCAVQRWAKGCRCVPGDLFCLSKLFIPLNTNHNQVSYLGMQCHGSCECYISSLKIEIYAITQERS